MATSREYAEFVCEQVRDTGTVRCRKMFGEYMVYINDKPLLLVCDNVVYVKMLPPLRALLARSEVGVPYEGAKAHYILDIEDAVLTARVIALLDSLTPLPAPRARAANKKQK